MELILTSIAVLSAFYLAVSPSAAVTSSFTKCYTMRTSTSIKLVPTMSIAFTATVPLLQTMTVTPVTTVSPAPITSTTTFTSTSTKYSTLSQQTDTFSTTSTVVTTSIFTAPPFISTIAASTTVVTTLTSGTTTIATPSGFMPVVSTLPNSAAKVKRTSLQGVDSLMRRGSTQQCPAINDPNALSAYKYPAAIFCYKFIEVFSTTTTTRTAQTTTTRTAAISTSTASVTTTTTSTATVSQMDASTTETLTSTSTIQINTTPTTSVTSTTTLIYTVQQPAATYYAACAQSNLVGTWRGLGLVNAWLSGTSLLYTNDSDAYDCCVSCITNQGCTSAAFAGSQPVGLQCLNGVKPLGPCSVPGTYNSGVSTSPGVLLPDQGYIVSNGNCAFYTY